MLAAGLFGALVGLLLPTPGVELVKKGTKSRVWRKTVAGRTLQVPNFSGLVATVLLMAFAAAAVHIGVGDSVSLQCVLAASGAALVAILIPTPARYDPR